MILTITRSRALSDKTGTFGHIAIDGKPFCASCEQPWNNNLHDISCIPAGEYQLIPYDSPTHGKTVCFHNPALHVYAFSEQIPKGQQGRSLCEIHIGNWPKDVKGCVAVGVKIADIAPHGRGVTSSTATMDKLRAAWGTRQGMKAVIDWAD